jgi:hypothetical protein
VRLQDLDQGGLDQLLRRISDLETATPLRNASVTAGRVRIGGTAVLLVDSSGGVVIHGSLNGDGTISWTGVTTLTGTTNLNGPLNVSGLTTLLNSLTVGAGGKITVAGMTIAQLASGIGGITWGTTFPSLYSDGASVAIGAAANQYISAASSGTAMVNGSRAFAIDGTSHVVQGALTTTSAANVYLDSSSQRLYRVTSARRFKLQPKPMKLAASLLDVPMKDWIDKGARKRKEPDVRIPGVIAEEVAAAGGDQFVTRDAEGAIEGVAYERLALARTQILNEKLDAALTRIDALEKKLAAVTGASD